jgi:hypothetical protein
LLCIGPVRRRYIDRFRRSAERWSRASRDSERRSHHAITALRNNFFKHLICRDFSEIFLVYELARLVVRGAQVVVGGKLSQPGVIRRPALKNEKAALQGGYF